MQTSKVFFFSFKDFFFISHNINITNIAPIAHCLRAYYSLINVLVIRVSHQHLYINISIISI